MKSNIDTTEYVLSEKDFADIFKTSVENLPVLCRKVIKESNFKYKVLTGKDRESVFLRVFSTLISGSLKISGPHRKKDWENGWKENYNDFVSGQFDLQKLIPKFVKHKEVIRFRGNYILPYDSNFETNFVKVIRYYLFSKYFKKPSKIFEFGCGTGLNLVAAAELFPKKQLIGLDWAQSSCLILEKLASSLNLEIKSILFDMFHPSKEVGIDRNSAVFTIGAMEQLGSDFKQFVNYIMKKKPSICINIEVIYELHNKDDLFEYVAAAYIERRNYLHGYLAYLKKLEKDRMVKIIEITKTFGGLYHDGYSYIVWKPIRKV